MKFSTLSVFAGVLSSLAPSVLGHGMMIGLVDCDTKELIDGGKIRNYDYGIKLDVDSLRAPVGIGSFGQKCRGAKKSSKRAEVNLKAGGKVCVALGMVLGAEHQGPCQMELQASDGKTYKMTRNSEQCAGGKVRSKTTPASSQCPNKPVPGMVTNDMCRVIWEYKLPNNFKAPKGNATIRWTWKGQHVSPAEFYENCQDVKIVSGGRSGNKNNSPQKKKSSNKKKNSNKKKSSNMKKSSNKKKSSSKKKSSNKEKSSAEKFPTCNASRSAEQRCDGKNAFVTCAGGKWLSSPMAKGTQCKQNGKIIAIVAA